jgi:23S rRNA pseudouridine1911/1915/1917 synthase
MDRRSRRTDSLSDGTTPLEFAVAEEETEVRLEHFVRRHIPGISRGSVQRLLERELVLVDGVRQPKGFRLRAGQRVVVAAGARSETPVPQPEMELSILEVLPWLVVIDKPPGVPCHPLVPGETDTVANALVARFPECATASPVAREGGLVHRLDATTSGVLLAARSPEAYGRLRGFFSASQVVKHYLALVAGSVTGSGEVRLALRTMPGDRRRMQAVATAEHAEAASAVTEYQPREVVGALSLVDLRARTGRRHQIRVHLAYVGHPLAGDALYGGPGLPGLEGAFLHASRVELVAEGVSFAAELPADRRELLRRLGFRSA